MFKHIPSPVRKSLEEVVLVWGSKRFTRQQMIKKLEVANFRAARIVTKTLEELEVTTPSQLWETDPYDLRHSKGFGDFSLFLCMVLLDSVGRNPEDWLETHAAERRRNRHREQEERAMRAAAADDRRRTRR